MNYKINKEELRAALSDKNAVSGIEKHLIQEGLKQIFLGTGPIEFKPSGSDTYFRTITPSLETYLLDSKIIEHPTTGEISEQKKKGTTVIVDSSHSFKSGICELIIDTPFDIFNLVTDTDIFYRDKKIIPRGGIIPYFSQIKSWGEIHSSVLEKKLVIDLRVPGIYGEDFNPSFLNNTGVFDKMTGKWGKCEFTIIAEKIE